jgi:hypothetical protein
MMRIMLGCLFLLVLTSPTLTADCDASFQGAQCKIRCPGLCYASYDVEKKKCDKACMSSPHSGVKVRRIIAMQGMPIGRAIRIIEGED